MKTYAFRNGYPLDREERDGFVIQLSFEDESLSPYDVYKGLVENEEDIENILNGKYTWAMAIVTVFKAGIELANTNLGCCEYTYDNLIEEFKASGYYEVMVSEAIEMAKDKLKELLS